MHRSPLTLCTRRLIPAVLLLGTISASAAEPPTTKIRDLNAVFLKAYTHILEGNRADAATNLQRAQQAERAAITAAERGNDKQARQHTDSALIFRELHASNLTILSLFEMHDTGELMHKAMLRIHAAEARYEKLTGNQLQRPWLTFQEVERFRKMGMTYSLRDPGILPFARSQWHRDSRR